MNIFALNEDLVDLEAVYGSWLFVQLFKRQRKANLLCGFIHSRLIYIWKVPNLEWRCS